MHVINNLSEIRSDATSCCRCIFLCVHYRTIGDTVRFLQTVDRQRHNAASHCIIVDNSGDCDELQAAACRVDSTLFTIVRPGTNLGYYNGAWAALQPLLGNLPEWVVVCNPDVLLEADFIDRLLSLQEPETTGVLAPRITSLPDGEELNPYFISRPSAVSMRLKNIFLGNVLLRRFYSELYSIKHELRRRYRPKQPSSERRFIYAPHGSCLVFHRRFFSRGGKLHHPAFLFGEEIITAEAARAAGLRIVFEPTLRVHHRSHSSTAADSKCGLYAAESVRLIVKTYFPLFRREKQKEAA